MLKIRRILLKGSRRKGKSVAQSFSQFCSGSTHWLSLTLTLLCYLFMNTGRSSWVIPNSCNCSATSTLHGSWGLQKFVEQLL